MKNLILFLLIGMMLFTACKKQLDSPDPGSQPDNQSLTQVEDNNDAKGESDQINNDVQEAISKMSTFNGRVAVDSVKPICGCSVDISNLLGEKKIVLNFDGTTPCGVPRRIRDGSIAIQLISTQPWLQAGGKLGITMTNFRVTRESNNKSWTFNGFKTLTNLYPVDWFGFLAGNDSIIRLERGIDIGVAVSNGGNFTYSVARRASIFRKLKAGLLRTTITADGDTSIFDQNKVDTWGTNRFNNSFINYLTVPYESDEYCGFGQPNKGTIVHKSNGNTVTVTAGVNTQGNPDIRDCAYGWKLRWNLSSGGTGEKIFSY